MTICIEKRFFNLNRLLLLPFGLWPGKKTKFTLLQGTLLCSFLMSSIAFLLSRLFIAECSFDFVVRIFSSTTFYVMLAIPSISFWINRRNIKYLLDQVQYIYDRLKDRNEIAIYDKYGYIAKHITIIVTVLLACGLCFSFVILYWPYVLDAVMPKNESYALRTMEIVTKYFKVSEKYYVLVLVHLNMACSVGLITLIATGTMMMSYFKHACGMFEIASYRIEQAMAIELLHIFDMKNEIIIYRKIICAVDIHRKAMEFAKCFVTSIEGSFFVLVITTVLCMSFNLFRVFQIELPMEKMEEVLLHLLSVMLILLIMFLANNTGQEIIDHSNNVYVITYNISWYLAPIRIQKLILFLLQRSNKIFTLSIGGLFTISLECFATLVSASMSYFTFMYSMQ
ncbi:hypothetical protein DMN91_004428 [Ooceraea biroi]|uniref:Odorant receptor n=1 Tax=Ooceraea biroi TaxID=2015173 RepID=A0A026W7M8_OOCBI|nr:uncharacterized protein LOC105282615 [Ooceraea biroi]XP_026825122.1 uncharacterized protein LOC105282615 [Ooceraea biroi]XP_026825124.1 uncharacterized protein LOC105282615 [Ooceraea biroi]XP_026825125.1 uncharacterized protein LOC105282615 [Ooceraea biroi]XP_026825126.1 uncharacterized protein LOC105282615 [Ooceraea biroi]XP_026825127.1 uncharacterized protein LOC105282615 [Ooceraea biroi]XP_026825128.1 uncharacterized protein LOC105282615 [Ooceraea biroi]XP_026825129.1 uncharacterized p